MTRTGEFYEWFEVKTVKIIRVIPALHARASVRPFAVFVIKNSAASRK